MSNLRQLGQGKELPLGVLASGRPAQQGDVVDHRLGQIAYGDEILVGGVALALAHLVVGVPHDGGAVDIVGTSQPKPGTADCTWGRRTGTRNPHHVGDAHQVIVDDVGKVVGGQAVPLDEHLVVQHFVGQQVDGVLVGDFHLAVIYVILDARRGHRGDGV